MLALRKLYDIDEDQVTSGITRILNYDYPYWLTFIEILVNLIAGICCVLLDTFAILLKLPLSFLATGTWSGVMLIINEILAILLTYYRTVPLFYISYVYRLICLNITFVFVGVNFHVILESCEDCSGHAYLWINVGLFLSGMVTRVPFFCILLFYLLRVNKELRRIAYGTSTFYI